MAAEGDGHDLAPLSPPWHSDKVPGGCVVRDAHGQALVYVYSRDNEAKHGQTKVLTKDEVRGVGADVIQPAFRLATARRQLFELLSVRPLLVTRISSSLTWPFFGGAFSFLRPCGAGSQSGRWSLAELAFFHERALARGRNVPKESCVCGSDLRRLCVCRILVLVLGPRNSSRGGKLLTTKGPPASLHLHPGCDPK
jgi:hypothetical protein